MAERKAIKMKAKAKISKISKAVWAFIKSITAINVIDCIAWILTVAFIATGIKCIAVGGSVNSQPPTNEEAVESTTSDTDDLPIVKDPEPVDLSEYNIAPAAPIHEEYPGYINTFTDLESRMDISEADLGRVIEWWTEEVPDTALRDQSVATAFIYASQQTNLDPIFLLALAGQESGWGTSKLHYETCNPYSIGMQDDGYLDLTFGDTYQESIINGAQYIRDNFYDLGENTLYSMEYGDIVYATDVNWMADIAEVMDTSYKVLLGEVE